MNKFITFFNFPPFSMNDKRIRKSLMEGSFAPILNSINCKVMEKLTKLITLNYDDLLFEVNFRVLALTRFLLSFSVLCVHSYLFSICSVYSWIPLLTCFFLFDWHICLLSNVSRWGLSVKLHYFKMNKSVYIASRSYRLCCQYVITFNNISIKTVIKGLHYFKVNKSVYI